MCVPMHVCIGMYMCVCMNINRDSDIRFSGKFLMSFRH